MKIWVKVRRPCAPLYKFVYDSLTTTLLSFDSLNPFHHGPSYLPASKTSFFLNRIIGISFIKCMSLKNENLTGMYTVSTSEPAEVNPCWPGIHKAAVAYSGRSLKIMDNWHNGLPSNLDLFSLSPKVTYCRIYKTQKWMLNSFYHSEIWLIVPPRPVVSRIPLCLYLAAWKQNDITYTSVLSLSEKS